MKPNNLATKEDLYQEEQLARLEAERDGTDPKIAASLAYKRYCQDMRRQTSKTITASTLMYSKLDLYWLEEARAVSKMRIDPAVRKLRERIDPNKPYRDVAMFICYIAGMVTTDIGKAFGLSQPVASKAIVRMRKKTGITRLRDMAVRKASSKSSKGRYIRVGKNKKRVWMNGDRLIKQASKEN